MADILERLRDLPAEAILADAAGRYAGRVAFATSLGIDDQVVTHMIAEAGLGIPIFTVDTGRLFPETHDLIERTSERYGVSIAVYCPDAAERRADGRARRHQPLPPQRVQAGSSAARPAR